LLMRVRRVPRPVASASKASEGNPPERVRRRVVPRIARRLLLGCVGGFLALLVGVQTNRVAALDAAITLRIQASKSQGLDRRERAASWPGFPPESRIIPPALIATSWLRG